MSSEQDTRLERLLCDYIERLNRGEAIDPETVRREHPDLAEQLLPELEVFQEFELESKLRPVGTLGDFELLGEIGRGGMGVVYEAWQNSMNRRVALKVLPAGVAADRQAFARFVREAQIAGQVRHPNVVAVHGLGLEAESPYYAMELVEGRTLAQLLALIRRDSTTPGAKPRAMLAEKLGVAVSALDTTLALRFSEVADGLHAAHAKSIVHRDVKPSNLIVGEKHSLRILDFGLARLEGHESLTFSAEIVGTPQYMSPEQARARKVPIDHRTDIWSLGATLYEVLTLRPPFRGRSHQETLSQILEHDPPPPRKLAPETARDLETIVLKCLAKEPALRYGTAEALAQDLRRFARHEPIEARPMGPGEKALRHAWRHRVRFATIASLVLVGMLGTALGAVLWSQHREATNARYEALLGEGIDALEIGLLTSPGEIDEGETLSLGLVHPLDLVYRGGTGPGRSIDAAERLRVAAELCPDRPEAPVHLHRALYASGDLRGSRVALREALARDRDFLPALLHEAHALREDGRKREAEALLGALDRGVADGWRRDWLDAHLAAVARDWERAERGYDRLLESDARPFAAFEKEIRLRRGRVLLKRGLVEEALRDFVSVWHASGRAVGPTFLLAMVYFTIDRRDAAVALLDDVSGGSELDDENRRALITLYLLFGEHEQAAAVAERLEDPCERYQGLLQVTPDYSNDVEIAEAALGEGCNAQLVYAELAEGLLRIGRAAEAESVVRRRLEEEVRLEASPLLGVLSRVLFTRGDFYGVIALLQGPPNPQGQASALAWAYLRNGELERAFEKFNDAVEFWPRNYVSYFGRSVTLYRLGHFEQALSDALKHARLGPHWDRHRLLRRLYNEPFGRSLFADRWNEVASACAEASRRPVPRLPRFLGFRALACVHGPEPDLEEARRLAEASVAAGRARRPFWLAETLGYLAEVRFARGEHAEAIRALERAVVLSPCWRSSAEDLKRYRRQLFPRLLTCASVDAWLARTFDQQIGTKRDPLLDLGRVRAATVKDSAAARYLEARLLEREGRTAEAARMLEGLLADGFDELAVALRVARLRAELGDREQALRLIEQRFARSTDRDATPWALWSEIASRSPSLSVAERLERLIRWLTTEEAEDASLVLDDLVWALRALRTDGGAIRIHCGGLREYVDGSGRIWERDRFYTGGRGDGFFIPELAGTDDDPLYHAFRAFDAGCYFANGYRIPLPSGRYELVLHFCLTVHKPLPWSFDVLIEGKRVAENVTPEIGVVFEERAEVSVSDGALDIDLDPARHGAFIDAIEVRPLDGESGQPSGEPSSAPR